jgi:hypothetical protein
MPHVGAGGGVHVPLVDDLDTARNKYHPEYCRSSIRTRLLHHLLVGGVNAADT